MEKTDILHIIPKSILRKLFLVLLNSMFLLTDLYFLHHNLFKIYDQIYIVLLCLCIGIIFQASLLFVWIIVKNSREKRKEDEKIDSYMIDAFQGSGTIAWLSLLIILDGTLDFSVKLLILCLFCFPFLKMLISAIRNPKKTLSATLVTLSIIVD